MHLVIRHARQLVQVAAHGERLRRGQAMRDLAIIPDGAVAIEGDAIAWVGPTAELPERYRDARTIDASEQVVLPGFVDSHTHLIFAGSRADEFEQRLQGVSYQAIAARGGGINATVRAVRQASKASLKSLARKRLDRMLAMGVTTVEIKSGYGLTLADEIKCLEAVAELNEEHPCGVVATFLGAHEVPPEYRENRGAYLRLLREEMLPAIARDGLAEFCDVFCEQGVFDVAESASVLERAAELGFKLKVHADEFTPLGGAELAGRLRATSADHLLHVTEPGIAALRDAGTVATLLPGTAFTLGVPYAPARRLIDAGLAIAVATDCNPGSCYSENLPLMGAMACTQMKMLPAEVINALTLNAAAALGRSDRLGSIEVGKQADLIVCDVPDHRELPYHFGVNHVVRVVKSGRVVVGA